MIKNHKLSLLGASFLFALVIVAGPFGEDVAHASPLTISSCNDLEKIASSSYPTYTTSASYVLTQSFSCISTATQNPNGGGGFYGFSPIADFTGTFNGAGYTISNLYISTTTPSVGLFEDLEGTSTVENLTLSGGSITGNQYVGAIAGEMNGSSSIQNATSSAAVTGTNHLGGLVGDSSAASTAIASSTSTGVVTTTGQDSCIGGLAGDFDGTISNSSSAGTIIGSNNVSNVGGIVGCNFTSGVVSSSHSSESIQIAGRAGYIGGIAGQNQNDIQNSYFTGSINASTTVALSNEIDGIVGDNASNGGVTNSFYNADVVSIMGAHRETPYGIYTNQYNAWVAGNYAPLSFSTYFPSVDSNGYYDITSLSSLENLLAFVYTNLSSDKFKITAPITLPSEFYIPNMNALEFNGGNNAISGLSLSRADWSTDSAFIGNVVASSTVTDIDLVNVSVTAQTAGGIVNNLDGTLTNSTISGSVSGTYEAGGAAANLNNSYDTITNVQSTVNTTGITNANGDDVYYIGGLVGYNGGSISSSSASSTVSSLQSNGACFGGLVGDNGNVIQSSYANTTLMITGTNDADTGGLVGCNSGPVSNSYATSAITASGNNDSYVGGLIGETAADITNSYASGTVTANGANDQYVAGLIASDDSGNIASSSATDIVTALGANSQDIGGLVGLSYGAISNSYATGNVIGTTTTQYIGGLDGTVDSGSITECYATGNVTGNNFVGGLTGISYGTITKSFATGNVTAFGTNAKYIGGFTGDNESLIHDAYATGNLVIDTTASSSVAYFGGFDGQIDSAIYNAYSTGNILGSINGGAGGYAGGFAGYNNGGGVVNSYSTGAGSVLASLAADLAGGFFIGYTNDNQLVNDADYYQGTPAIGFDVTAQTYGDALLATYGYGTDDHTLSNFYTPSEPVYAQGQSGAWDFSSVWAQHANTFPTFIWYSGVTPMYTITATVGAGGAINDTGSFSVLQGANQTYTITPSSGYTIANVLVDGTSVGPVSTYTFTNVTTTHTISVTFTAPASSGTGGTSGGGTVQNQVTNLITNGNTPAATALMQEYPGLFSNGATSISSSSTSSSSIHSSFVFTRSLTLSSTGKDVLALQKYLNAHGFIVAATGAGSPGNETTYFGKATRAALAKFQKAKDISPAAGYFGSITRAYITTHS